MKPIHDLDVLQIEEQLQNLTIQPSIGRKTALKTKASIQRKSRKQLKKEIRHLKLKLKRIQLDKLDDNGQLKKDNINKDKCENADIGGNLTTNKQANEEGDVLMDTAVFSID